MIEFLLDGANLPFTVALAIVALIGFLEGVGAVLGLALSNLLDQLLPEVEIDAPDVPDHGAVSEFLSWLRFREVPVIIFLLAFLISFALSGLILQNIISAIFGFLLPAFVAAVIAFLLAMPGVRLFSSVLVRIMPRDETSAVASDSFIGRTATITLGTAKRGSAAQAKLKDGFEQTHYVMVEPDEASQEFAQGETVLLVRGEGAVFFAIPVTNTQLREEKGA